MRTLAILVGGILLLAVVAFPAVAGTRLQPKVDVLGVGWAQFSDLVNGDTHTEAREGFEWVSGPGNYTFATAGTVNHVFNPALSRDEFDIVFGDVDITHAKDNTQINVYQESFVFDMFAQAGGCGTVTVQGDGTLRVGSKTWTATKSNPYTRSFTSAGANCP